MTKTIKEFLKRKGETPIEQRSPYVTFPRLKKKLDLNKRSMAVMSIGALASFFDDQPKSIDRGENH